MDYKDLADLPEDTRLRQIGDHAMAHPGSRLAIVVDDFPGKAERYIRKLAKWYPKIQVVERVPGPIKRATSIIIMAEE